MVVGGRSPPRLDLQPPRGRPGAANPARRRAPGPYLPRQSVSSPPSWAYPWPHPFPVAFRARFALCPIKLITERDILKRDGIMLCSGKCHRLPNVSIVARMRPQATRWLKAAKIEARHVRRGIG